MADGFGFIPDNSETDNFGFIPDKQELTEGKSVDSSLPDYSYLAPDPNGFLANVGGAETSFFKDMLNPSGGPTDMSAEQYRKYMGSKPKQSWLAQLGEDTSLLSGAATAPISPVLSIGSATGQSIAKQGIEPENWEAMPPEMKQRVLNIGAAGGQGVAGVLAAAAPLLHPPIAENVFPPERAMPKPEVQKQEGPIIENADYTSSERPLLTAPEQVPPAAAAPPAPPIEPSSHTQGYDFDSASFGIKDDAGNFVKTGFESPEEAQAHAGELSVLGEKPKPVESLPAEDDFGFVPDNAETVVAPYEPPGVPSQAAPSIPPVVPVPPKYTDNRNYDEVMKTGNFEQPQDVFTPEVAAKKPVQENMYSPVQTKANNIPTKMQEVRLKSLNKKADSNAGLSTKEMAEREALSVKAIATPANKLPTAQSQVIKYPVQNFLKQNGGVEVGSNLAGELNSMGVNNRTAPGLFKAKGRGGLKDIDNFPHGEWNISPAPADETGNYVNRQYILDSIASERAGKPVTRQDNVPESKGIEAGSPEDLAHYQAQQLADETETVGAREAAREELPEPLPIEKTSQGEQTIIPGAEQIAPKVLAERQMAKPMQAVVPQKPIESGLFDVAGRGQGDLLAPPAKPEAANPITTAVNNLLGDESGAVPSDVLKEIRDTVAPTMASESAAKTAMALRKAYGLARRERVTDEMTLGNVAKVASKMNAADHGDFYNYVEGRSKGAQLNNKELQPLADSVRAVYQRMRTRLEAMPEHLKMNFIQDYFTHQWKNPEKAQAFVNDFIAAQGSMRSLKERKLPTIAEGLAHGLELMEPNPVRAVSRYLGSMNNYIASVHSLRSIADDLGARFSRQGMQPEGYEPLVGRNAERIQDAKVDPKSGKVVPAHTMHLYAPADVARIYNRFYSKGLESTRLKTTYQLVREAVNANTLMELGLSTYHAGTITIQSLNQDLARVLKNSLVGDWKGVSDAMKKFAVPGAHYKAGRKLVEQYQGLKDHGVDVEKVADLFAKGNLRIGNDPLSVVSKKGFHEASKRGELPEIIERLKKQATEGHGLGLIKSGAEVTARMVSDVSAPLFNHYIPAIKMSSFSDLMTDWLRQNPNSTPAEIDIATTRIANLIEDRFGEMNMENVFWHRMAKQLTGLTFRAPGWDLGLVRQLAGPGKDAFTILSDAAKGKKFNPANLDRALYMVAAITLFAAMNSLMTWLKTGTPPTQQQLRDFIAYRTGGMRKAFDKMLPERGLLPGHGREVVGLYPIPSKGIASGAEEEVKNKIASLPKHVWDIVTNSDWKDKPIYDPKSKKWVWRTPGIAQAAYLAAGFKPFMVDGLMPDKDHPGGNLSFMERSLGVRPAGTRITDREDLGNFLAKKH